MKGLTNLVMLVALILQSFAPAMEVLAREARQPLAISQQQKDRVEEVENPTPTPQDESTLTPTITPNLVPTYTPNLGEIITETPDATLTPAETPSPVLVEEIKDETPLDYGITLWAEPEFISPGRWVNLEWQVKAEKMEGLDLLFVLPYGVTVNVDKKNSTESEQPVEIYRIPAEEKGTLNLSIGTDVEMPVLIHAFLLPHASDETFTFFKDIDIIHAEAQIALVEKAEVRKNGGRVEGLNGKVKVIFSSGALSESAEVFIHRPLPESMPPHSLSGYPFEIKARSQDNRKGISTFNGEVRIEVDYSYLDLDESLAGELVLYWYNEEIDEWEALPSWTDAKTQTLHASTTHFTVFDINIHNWQASRLPTLDNFQTAGFTGAGVVA
jgi:hypothetical protein